MAGTPKCAHLSLPALTPARDTRIVSLARSRNFHATRSPWREPRQADARAGSATGIDSRTMSHAPTARVHADRRPAPPGIPRGEFYSQPPILTDRVTALRQM